jgi:hypothetical protein
MLSSTFKKPYWYFGATAVSLLLCSPVKAADFNQTDVVLQWNDAALQAIRDTRPGPPIGARELAILHTGIFDAWAAYDPVAKGTQLGGTLRRPVAERTLANKTKAISYAAYTTLVDLFPTETQMFDHLMNSLGYNPADTSTDPSTASGIGHVAAKVLLEFRHHDGSNQLGDLHPGPYSDYSGYTPVNTPDVVNDIDHWQPLRVPDGQGGFITQKFAAPFWENVTPFALTSADQFLPPPPKTIESDPAGFKEQAQEILDYSANLTDEQKAIAEYWADGPGSELPPGHWNRFGQFISERDHYDLDQEVKLFFILNNALLDTSIAAWDAKRVYDSVRPITAIHELFKDQRVSAWGGPNQGTQLILGQDWQPYQVATLVTPPFPEHVSGHSSFSAASAEILKRFTGSDLFGASYTQLAGTSRIENGPTTDISLHWDTFSDAADQAGLSRRYGGIHFKDGDLAGRHLGRQVANQVWQKAQAYISPESVPEPTSIWGLLTVGLLYVRQHTQKQKNKA